MAKVEYSAEINELKGSVGGTTFQRNKSGTIAKLKSSLVYNPTLNQLISRSSFNSIVKAWSVLSFANKLLWNTFAATYTKYDYWGVQKTLSGFNWFVSLNVNRALTGQAQLDSPPAYVTPITAPNFRVFPLSDSLSIMFDVFPEQDNYYLFVYATPPIRSVNLQSRRSLRLISVFSPDQVLWRDLTSDWESYFGITWPSANVSESYNILVAVSAVHKDTGIAGAFFLDVQALDLTNTFQAVGDSVSNLGQQAGEAQATGLSNVGSGILLCGTASNGHILRSTDYGANWSDLGQQSAQLNIFDTAYLGSGVCVAGTYNGGLILRSTDYGANWSSLGNMFGEQSVTCFAYLGNGICLAGTQSNGHILRSTDYGVNWSDLGQQFAQTTINDIVYLGNGICLAGTNAGGLVLRSTDYGANWSNLGQQFSQTSITSFGYFGAGVVVAGSSTGGLIIRSTDYGANWSNLGQQFSEVGIISFAYLGNGVMLAGSRNTGYLLRSTDYGVTWSNLGQQASETRILSLLSLFNLTAIVGTQPNANIEIASN